MSFHRTFENNYFGKVSLMNLVSTWSNLPKHCIFADSLLIVSYVQGVLLTMFFHCQNKLLFYIGVEQTNPLSFFSLVSFMICCFFAQQMQSRSLLETDEADEVFNVTENKTNWSKKFSS